MIETATFVCSICDEPSHDICVYCTKDACRNHRCMRCLRCSDCCICESPLTSPEPEPEPAIESEPVAVEPQPVHEQVSEQAAENTTPHSEQTDPGPDLNRL